MPTSDYEPLPVAVRAGKGFFALDRDDDGLLYVCAAVNVTARPQTDNLAILDAINRWFLADD